MPGGWNYLGFTTSKDSINVRFGVLNGCYDYYATYSPCANISINIRAHSGQSLYNLAPYKCTLFASAGNSCDKWSTWRTDSPRHFHIQLVGASPIKSVFIAAISTPVCTSWDWYGSFSNISAASGYTPLSSVDNVGLNGYSSDYLFSCFVTQSSSGNCDCVAWSWGSGGNTTTINDFALYW